jgi:LacI family transcriptional regulator
MKRPTQKDVAQLAGVSRSTVSYVLNDQTEQKIPISLDTRKRVLEAMAALGYEPDGRAQSLRRGTSRTFGILFQTLQNPYFVQLLDGIQREAQANGYSLHLSQSFVNPEQESQSLKELVRHQVDGFILLTSFEMLPARKLKHIHRSGRPVVVITSTGSEFDHVLTGYADATRELMSHLFGLGHSRIGLVYGVAVESHGHDRLLTYYEVLKAAGLPPDDRLVERCGDSIEDGYAATRRLLSRADRPTAVLVINDLLAIGALRAAADLGLRVPDDVSIAGFDDITFASFTIPRLTTVTSFPQQDGRDAVRLLLRRLAELDRPCEVIVAGSQVIFRDSTGPVPQTVGD